MDNLSLKCFLFILKEITNKIKEGLDNLHSQSAQSIPKTLQSVNLAEVIACLFPKHLCILLLFSLFFTLITLCLQIQDCIQLFGLRWHPEHLMCARCSKALASKEKIFLHNDGSSVLCKVTFMCLSAELT